MNGKMNELDLQRLVDGELSGEERQSFLRGLDDTSGAWREVALAFVEEQVLSGILGAGVCAPRQIAPAPAGVNKPAPMLRLSLLTAVAASFIIFIGLGFFWGQSAGRAEILAEFERGKGKARVTGENLQAPLPEGGVMVAQGTANPPRVLETPGFPHPMADPVMALHKANERLRNLGYRLDAETQYYGGKLKDGRRVVLPVQTVMVNYHGL